MNRQFYNKRHSLTVTDKQSVWANYSIDQNNFAGHLFSIKSYKMSFKILPVKIQQSKNLQGQIGLSQIKH